MDDNDGRKAPSPESRRRSDLLIFEEDENEDLPSARKGRSGSNMQRPNLVYRGDEEDTGFMETKPILARPYLRNTAAGRARADETDVVTFDDASGNANEEESRYHKDRARAPRLAAKGSRGSQDDSELRRHFQRRTSLKQSQQGAKQDEPVVPLSTVCASSVGVEARSPGLVDLQDHVASPNPPGVNEKIQEFLESQKRTRPRSSSTTVTYEKPMREPETLMQMWPTEMEQLLRSPEQVISNLDCTLEEYVDIVCALVGIPVYENRVDAVHQLFTLYLDYKDIPR